MKRHTVHAIVVACAAFLLGTDEMAAAAGFEKLSGTGDTVLTECNPTDAGWNHVFRVNGLPGEPGYVLIAARLAPLVYNDIEMGQLQERV